MVTLALIALLAAVVTISYIGGRILGKSKVMAVKPKHLKATVWPAHGEYFL